MQARPIEQNSIPSRVPWRSWWGPARAWRGQPCSWWRAQVWRLRDHSCATSRPTMSSASCSSITLRSELRALARGMLGGARVLHARGGRAACEHARAPKRGGLRPADALSSSGDWTSRHRRLLQRRLRSLSAGEWRRRARCCRAFEVAPVLPGRALRSCVRFC